MRDREYTALGTPPPAVHVADCCVHRAPGADQWDVTVLWALFLLLTLGGGTLGSLLLLFLLRSVSPICLSFPSPPQVRS